MKVSILSVVALAAAFTTGQAAPANGGAVRARDAAPINSNSGSVEIAASDDIETELNDALTSIRSVRTSLESALGNLESGASTFTRNNAERLARSQLSTVRTTLSLANAVIAPIRGLPENQASTIRGIIEDILLDVDGSISTIADRLNVVTLRGTLSPVIATVQAFVLNASDTLDITTGDIGTHIANMFDRAGFGNVYVALLPALVANEQTNSDTSGDAAASGTEADAAEPSS